MPRELDGVDTVDETITSLANFFKSVDSPIALSEENIGRDQADVITEQMHKNGVSGMHFNLDDKDRNQIVEFML